jgi:hypothetical protein
MERILNEARAGKFDLHDEVCFTTEIEAEEHGVELGKHWVNDRIQCMQWFPQASIELRRLLADRLTAGANMQITDSVCISGERLWFSRHGAPSRLPVGLIRPVLYLTPNSGATAAMIH